MTGGDTADGKRREVTAMIGRAAAVRVLKMNDKLFAHHHWRPR
jgi:hypothetical protein